MRFLASIIQTLELPDWLDCRADRKAALGAIIVGDADYEQALGQARGSRLRDPDRPVAPHLMRRSASL